MLVMRAGPSLVAAPSSGTEVLRVEPFDAIEFDLRSIWAD
jgi:hypothetical protein